MNLEALRLIFATRFNASWKLTGAPDSPIYLPTEFENVPFTQPANDTWARFSIKFGEIGEATVGTFRDRCAGLMWIQIFAKPGAGTKVFNDARDKAAGFFDNWQYDGAGWDIEVRRCQLDQVGQNLAGNWYQKNITIPFRADFQN